MCNGVTLGGRPYHFCEKLAECGGIEHLLGQQLLKLGVLFFECLQALRLDTSIPPYLAFQL